MRMQKRQFRIGELAENLGVERFVVRFWEKEFGLKPTRSEGGQRFYEEKDLEQLQLIKELLYNKGFTISGAKKILQDKGQLQLLSTMQTVPAQKAHHFGTEPMGTRQVDNDHVVASQVTTMDAEPTIPTIIACSPETCSLREQVEQLKLQLVKLKEFLQHV